MVTESERRAARVLRVLVLVLALVGSGLVTAAPAAAAGTLQYPDLITLEPRDLRLARTDVSVDGSGQLHNVLRFTNTPWNRGEGTFVLRAVVDPLTGTGPAFQRVFDDAGGFVDRQVGDVEYHDVHAHFHFDGWGRYELWTKAAYDAWVASGRTTGAPQWTSPKTTSCVLDEEPVQVVPGTPALPKYDWTACNLASDNTLTMGLSPGWGDTYDHHRYEQWIDLGQSSLTDGSYVLRSVTDADNILWESPTKADPAREANNESVLPFSIAKGAIQDGRTPSGTVWINGVDTETSNTVVNLKAVGRDDVSGVDAVRISNDGVTWSERAYTGVDSTPMDVSWDLADRATGGNATQGPHTVHVQFRDRTGKWSPTVSDTINLVSCAVSASTSNYAQAINGDGPVGYWRFGEACGTSATDERGAHPATYVNGPSLARPSLLAGDGANTSVTLDGRDDHVAVPHAAALAGGSAFSIEAWIRPDVVPAAGGWASVVTKQESYSIQFNGPRLEFTIVQNGARRRLQAPAGAIVAGTTYHVVATYDGAMQRLYLNGAQVGSVALTGGVTGTTHPLRIGSWDGAGEFFAGTVDDVALYTKVLNATQVANHEAAGRSAAVTKPAAPTNLAAAATGSSTTQLSWTDNASNETGFVLERSATADFATVTSRSFAPDVTAFSDSGLTPATTYHYRIRAVNTSGDSAFSNTASVTTASAPAPPAAPTGLRATAVDPTRVSVAWTDASTNETGFVLERSTSSAFSGATARTLAAGTTTADDSGLTASTTYYYRVRATGSAGDSPWSSTAMVTTPATPPPPTGSAYAAAVLADAPRSFWRLGETSGTAALDQRSANPGTYRNGALLGQAGLLAGDADRAVRLDGVDDHVAIPHTTGLNAGTAFSVEAWFRPTSVPAAGSWASLVTKQESYSLQFNGPRLEFTIVQNGARRRLQAPAGAVVAGTTYHVVATYDGTTQRLYLNGAQVASTALKGGVTATTHPLRIGSWDGAGEYFAGTVDEVALYPVALTAAQVSGHNTRGRTA